MTTAYCTSADGLTGTGYGDVLTPTEDTWDQRGARVTAVLRRDPLVVAYDGQATAEDNWHEVTGVAHANDGVLTASATVPIARDAQEVADPLQATRASLLSTNPPRREGADAWALTAQASTTPNDGVDSGCAII